MTAIAPSRRVACIATIAASSMIATVGTAHAAPAASSDATNNTAQSIIDRPGTKVVQTQAPKTNVRQDVGSALPKGAAGIAVTSDGSRVLVDNNGTALPDQQQAAFWGSAWKVAKCAAYITAAVAPGGAAIKAIKGLGGIKKTAQLLVKAGNKSDFAKIAGGAAATIIGIDGISKNCF